MHIANGTTQHYGKKQTRKKEEIKNDEIFENAYS